MAKPSTALFRGRNLANILQEQPGSPDRVITFESDTVTRKYKTRWGSIPQILPAMGGSFQDFPNHLLSEIKYNRTGESDITDVTLTFKPSTFDLINPQAPLPPNEVEYIAGTAERHIGSHPSYVATWNGTPTVDGKPGSTADPRGIPTTAATKPGVDSYLIPTGIYRKTSYSHSLPKLSIQDIGKRNIPSGESGANMWLKTAYTLKITKGVYQLSEEWTFLPIGTWDTDIYGVVTP